MSSYPTASTTRPGRAEATPTTAGSAAGSSSLGWSVHEHAVRRRLAAARRRRRSPPSSGVVERIPDDAVVLLDGLIASTAPEVLVPQARRLRLVVLVHMPLGHRPRR